MGWEHDGQEQVQLHVDPFVSFLQQVETAHDSFRIAKVHNFCI